MKRWLRSEFLRYDIMMEPCINKEPKSSYRIFIPAISEYIQMLKTIIYRKILARH